MLFKIKPLYVLSCLLLCSSFLWGQNRSRNSTANANPHRNANVNANPIRNSNANANPNPNPNACYSGRPENNSLHQQIARSPFAEIIRNENLNPNRRIRTLDHTPACLTNRNSAAPGLAGIAAQFGDLARYGETMRNQGRIRTECIAAALTRTNGTNGFICGNPADPNPRNITPGNTDPERANNGPCITPELVDHITFVTNQALACMGELNQPINPEIVFRKINNESGYHFYKAYGGGIGIGQLTSIAARQVLSGTTPVYQRFKANMSPACRIFKRPVMDMESRLEGAPPSNSQLTVAAQQGARNRPQRANSTSPQARSGTVVPRPATPSSPAMQKLEEDNWCNLISSSNGLAANTMISLLYFAHTRANIVDSRIRPVLASNGISDVSSQQRFIDLATLGAFGRDGNRGAMNLVDPLRSSLRSANTGEPGFLDRAYARFSADAPNHVGYLGEIQSKAREVLSQIPTFNRISGRNFSATSTADCVEPAVPTR